MSYPWFEEYCLAKPGAVKGPAKVTSALVGDPLGVPPAFSFMIGERGLIGRKRFVFQSGTEPLALPPDPFMDMRPHFRFTQNGNFIRPFIDLKLTSASGDYFRHKFEEDIFRAYDPNNEGWNRICIDGLVPDDVLRMSYTITFQNMSVKDREAISGPEKLCPKEEGRRCRLCSIFCPTGNQVKYPWIEEHCLSKADTHLDFKEEWQMVQYMVKWKIFAMQCRDETGRPVITLKLPPEMRESLSREFRDVIPGYSLPRDYLNTTLWNSVYLDGEVPEEALRDMIDQSYAIIRKRGDERRREI